MSGDIERYRKTHIDSLSPEQRAQAAHRCAMGFTEGKTLTEMSLTENLTTNAIKTLIAEHAAYVRNARPDTKTLQEEEYRRFYGEMKRISPLDDSVSALVRAKAVEARIQLLTRLDKVMGHEIQGEVEGAANSIADLARKLSASGDFDGVSAMDMGRVGEHEDIEDAVIVDEGDDDDAEV